MGLNFFEGPPPLGPLVESQGGDGQGLSDPSCLLPARLLKRLPDRFPAQGNGHGVPSRIIGIDLKRRALVPRGCGGEGYRNGARPTRCQRVAHMGLAELVLVGSADGDRLNFQGCASIIGHGHLLA